MNTEAQEIELSLAAAKEKVELAEDLVLLENNPQFKRIIIDKYLKSYALNLVNMKASIGAQDEKHQKYIDAQLNAIGHLSQFFRFIQQEGRIAKESIEADQNELNSIYEEGV